jgi:carboxypeptidase Q
MKRSARLALVALLTPMLTPVAGRAQGADSVLARIERLGRDSSRALDYLQVLSDSIGPRLTGTRQQKNGNDWLVAQYKALGVNARNEPYGTWRGWTRGTLHVDLMAPRVRTLEAWLLGWSPGTNGKDVTGPVVVVPDLADSAALVRWLPSVKGRFVAISRAETSCRAPESWRTNGDSALLGRVQAERAAADSEFTRRLARTGYNARTLPVALEKAGAAGVLSANWSQGWGVTKLISRARTERIPHVLMGCEDYGLVARLAERNQGPVLRVRSDARVGAEVPVWNTVAEIKGSEKPDEYVMLSAHFDTWDPASGTTDNGTGTVTMLEAVRLLRMVQPNPKRTILVGHWSGEEQGLNGSRSFAADHPEVVRGLQALFNQDNGTGPIVAVSGSGLASAESVLGRWFGRLPASMTSRLRYQFPGRPATGGSDHASFACYGAPAFGLSSAPWDYFSYTWHTDRDTYDKAVPEFVRGNATMVAMLAYLASEDPETFPRGGAQGVAFDACPKPARAWREFTR